MPVPVGSPPCAMNPSSTRWKVTPLKKPLQARNTKLFTVMGALSAYNSILNSPPFAIFTVAKYLPAVSINNAGAVPYDADAGIESNTAQADNDDSLVGCAVGTGGSVATGSETIGVDVRNEHASEAISSAMIDTIAV